MGLLLPTEGHTATHQQNQILVEIMNRHMPAAPRLPPATRPARCRQSQLPKDSFVEELRCGTGVEVGGRHRQHHQVDRDAEIDVSAKHVEKTTKDWIDKDKIGLLWSLGIDRPPTIHLRP
jgi:hypothetical protein